MSVDISGITGYAQSNVGAIQIERGLAELGNKLAHLGTRALRTEEVHGKALVLFSTGRKCQQEHENTHAANPVGKAAPE